MSIVTVYIENDLKPCESATEIQWLTGTRGLTNVASTVVKIIEIALMVLLLSTDCRLLYN